MERRRLIRTGTASRTIRPHSTRSASPMPSWVHSLQCTSPARLSGASPWSTSAGSTSISLRCCRLEHRARSRPLRNRRRRCLRTAGPAASSKRRTRSSARGLRSSAHRTSSTTPARESRAAARTIAWTSRCRLRSCRGSRQTSPCACRTGPQNAEAAPWRRACGSIHRSPSASPVKALPERRSASP